jgi:HAD superfamily hydrolase (TIGR01509 family)
VNAEALVFDFDGLIVDTETSEFETVREVYVAHGIDLTIEEWSHRLGTHARHWADELEDAVGPLPDREAMLLQRREVHHARAFAEPALPGVERLIAEAVDRGLKLAVASSSDEWWVSGHLERLGLLDHFACFGCHNDELRAKPAPDVYRHVCETLQVEPSRALALEDSLHGVRAARAAGLRCVAVPGALTRHLDLSEADLVLESLADQSLDGLLARIPG